MSRSNPRNRRYRQITDDEREELSRIATVMPYRTRVPGSGRSSDLTNVLFIGSHNQMSTAFNAAGWTQPSPPSFRDHVHWIRAVAELRGDGGAPMSLLLLNGAEPDMSWQKGLNDVSKRHHIRMWKAAGTWHGREIWVGAATRDIDFAYLRPGKKLSHKIRRTWTRSATKSPMIWRSRPAGTFWIGRTGLTFRDSPAMPRAIP